MKREYDFSTGRRGAVLPPSKGKSRITIRLDTELVDWFRQQADRQGSGGYQSMINSALREYMSRDRWEVALRRVLREELHRAG